MASAAPFIPFTNTQDFTAVNNLLNTIPTNTSMYGQRIFIKANIINVNGIMQSGKDNYTLNLDTGSDTRVADEIKELLLLGATGRFLLPQATARNPDFTVFFNTATNSIEVAGAVTISGGHIDLDGSILNTGNGQIRVLGGYGQINVVNNTAYGLQVDKLDASQRGDGVLTILDHAKPNAVNGNPLYTVYTQNASGTTVTTDDGAGHVTTSSTIPAIYQVAANWRYGWTVGYQQSVIDSKHIESSNWLGAINLGTVSFNDYTTVNQGAPTLQGAGGYYYLDTNPLTANNAYDHSYQDITTSAGSWKETFHDVRSTWYGKKTYISDYQRVQGHEILNTHDISAHRDIGIQFFGASEATVNVISTSNQDVVIGAILNTTGTTTVASGGAITELGGGVIGGRRVVLTAATGLGTAARALAVKVVNPADAAGGASSLSAVTSGGDINIADNDGVLAIDHVIAAAGDVTLTASKGIVVGMQDASTWYEGLVQGGAIVLNAGATTTPTVNPGGPIGNSIAHPLVVESGTLPKDTVTVTANGDVYLQDKNGDLQLNQLITTGNVWVNVVNGNLLDFNNTQVVDQRTRDELANGLWSDLGLTAGTGANQKILDTIASYTSVKEQEYRTYWQYRSTEVDPSVHDTSFRPTLSAADVDYYTNTLHYDAAAITTLQNALNAEYVDLDTRYSGFGSTYNPNFHYALSASESAALTGSIKVWTEEELLYSMSSGLLKPTADTQSVIEDPNIVGLNVTIIASKGVGNTTGKTTIDVATVRATGLTIDQRVAFAGADRPDLTYVGGNIISGLFNFSHGTNTDTDHAPGRGQLGDGRIYRRHERTGGGRLAQYHPQGRELQDRQRLGQHHYADIGCQARRQRIQHVRDPDPGSARPDRAKRHHQDHHHRPAQ